MEQKDLDLLKEIEDSDAYWKESIISDFTEEICRLMSEEGVNRAQLARKLGSSSAYVTKILGGYGNFTLSTMTKIARALGTIVRVHLAHKDAVVHWEDESITSDVEINVYPLSKDIKYVQVGYDIHKSFIIQNQSTEYLPRVVHG